MRLEVRKCHPGAALYGHPRSLLSSEVPDKCTEFLSSNANEKESEHLQEQREPPWDKCRVGASAPSTVRAHPVIWCHQRKADDLFHVFEAGEIINNKLFLLKKILYINLLWGKITVVTTEHLCQKRNTSPSCTYLYNIICIVHSLIHLSDTSEHVRCEGPRGDMSSAIE